MRGLGSRSFLSILVSAFLSLFWRFSSLAFKTIGSAFDFALGPGALKTAGVACINLASWHTIPEVTGEVIGRHARPISLRIIILKSLSLVQSKTGRASDRAQTRSLIRHHQAHNMYFIA